jgi:GNAT superfamily N-acetyltransferase
MVNEYEIINTETSDLQLIFELFDQSISYQERNGYPAWRNYDKNAIIKDIENKNQYKIIIDSITGIVFSVCYTDKLIWGELENGNSIYLHRIVVNPACKGRKLFGVILDWGIRQAKQRGVKSIRMDTWADNTKIINYYLGFGFIFINNYTTPDIPELPVHNRKLPMALLEYTLEQK